MEVRMSSLAYLIVSHSLLFPSFLFILFLFSNGSPSSSRRPYSSCLGFTSSDPPLAQGGHQFLPSQMSSIVVTEWPIRIGIRVYSIFNIQKNPFYNVFDFEYMEKSHFSNSFRIGMLEIYEHSKPCEYSKIFSGSAKLSSRCCFVCFLGMKTRL